jgi:HlyD family secretion protein
LDPQDVQQQLAMAQGGAVGTTGRTPGRGEAAANPGPADSTGAHRDTTKAVSGGAGGAGTITLPNGSTITLPPGVKEADVRAVMNKRMSGQELSDDDRALMRKVFARSGGGGGGGRTGGGGRPSRAMASSYIVFVLRGGKPVPVQIKTGLTDLDYVEVLSGLNEGDKVLLLPSAGLVNSQREMKERFQRMTGGGGLPGVQQSGGTQRPTSGSR